MKFLSQEQLRTQTVELEQAGSIRERENTTFEKQTLLLEKERQEADELRTKLCMALAAGRAKQEELSVMRVKVDEACRLMQVRDQNHTLLEHEKEQERSRLLGAVVELQAKLGAAGSVHAAAGRQDGSSELVLADLEASSELHTNRSGMQSTNIGELQGELGEAQSKLGATVTDLAGLVHNWH